MAQFERNLIQERAQSKIDTKFLHRASQLTADRTNTSPENCRMLGVGSTTLYRYPILDNRRRSSQSQGFTA